MARIQTAGAELQVGGTNVLGIDGGVAVGTVTRDTSIFRSGAASWKCDSTGANTASYKPMRGLASIGVTTYVRMYYCFSHLPGSTVKIMTHMGTGVNGYYVSVTSAGMLQFMGSDVGVTVTADSTTWYCIELSGTVDAGGTTASSGECRINNISVATYLTTVNIQNTFQFGWVEAPGASKVLYLDDYACNDSSGGSQNTWPGSGKVVLLKPGTDSAVGSGWTLGTGTAIAGNSGATAVKNTPPLGVADLAAGSDTKQIRNASSATADYDTGLDSYTTAGISANDTINVVVPHIITAAPVTTAAKTGQLVLVSNPAGATDSFSTFYSGVNAGTYATGWKTTIGTPQYAPSVTLGTRPVLRADITGGTATRIAMVCSMGMYVDYTPAPIRAPEIVALQAVNRSAVW